MEPAEPAEGQPAAGRRKLRATTARPRVKAEPPVKAERSPKAAKKAAPAPPEDVAEAPWSVAEWAAPGRFQYPGGLKTTNAFLNLASALFLALREVKAEQPRSPKAAKKAAPHPLADVAESQPWSVAEWAVALGFDNPRATVLVLVFG